MVTAMERIGLIVLAGLLTAVVPSASTQPQQKPAPPTSDPAEGLDNVPGSDRSRDKERANEGS